MTMPCIVPGQPLLLGLLHVCTTIGLNLLASIGGIVNCLFLERSGRRMQRVLQFRLGSHQLPIVLGRLAGGQHVARASRVCTQCGSVAVADDLHINVESPAL